MQDDKGRKQGRTTRVQVLLSLAIGACVTLLASGCSKSHMRETVTVAPRAAATQPKAINVTTATNFASASSPVGIEAEAAGDELAHAVVALKARRRSEALYYMTLARTQLNRVATDTNAKSNPTHERITIILSELDTAERAVRHNLTIKVGRNSSRSATNLTISTKVSISVKT